MPKWRKDSTFGPGLRRPLCREQRAQIRARLRLARRPHGLSSTAVRLGEALLSMIGADGRLDPSVDHLAVLLGVVPSTVTRCLARLRDAGFITWTRRLVRDARTGWRCEQTSNSYALAVPDRCDVQNARAAEIDSVPKLASRGNKVARRGRDSGDAGAYASAAAQLRALGLAVPPHWPAA